MYVYSNVEALSRNHCSRGRAVRITYTENVHVPLVIQNAMRMRHIVIRRLPGCKIFFHITDNFRKDVTEYNTRVLIFSATFYLKHSSFYEFSEIFPMFLSDSNRT
jgi:hypothetical protein